MLVDLLPLSFLSPIPSFLYQSRISSARHLLRCSSLTPSTSSAATLFSFVPLSPSSHVDTIHSFVLIDDFLSLGSPQFFCYSLAPSFPYTLCDSSHATLLADSLHGHQASLSTAARNIFVHELSVRRARLQEAFHAMQPVNDALQALLRGDVCAAEFCLNCCNESCGDDESRDYNESMNHNDPISYNDNINHKDPINYTKSINHANKRSKRSTASIRSYRCERHGETLELHVTGEAGDLTGEGTLQAATQRTSFQQFCDAFTLSSTFDATIRIVGACPSSLTLFLCTSSHTQFLGNVTLRPQECEIREKPRLLLKESLRPSLRALLPQGSTERFLQSGTWAVELPLTLEEAEDWANQLSEEWLDLSNLPPCKRVLDLLRVSLLDELMYWKSELLVGMR